MAHKEGSAEALVLDFIKQQNRPVNVQNVADAMQKHGLKKTAIQKTLDVLAAPVPGAREGEGQGAGEGVDGVAEGCQVVYKDYGKQRIYMARQDSLEVLSAEDLAAVQGRITALQGEAVALREECAALEKARGSLESSLTLPQIQEQIQALTSQNIELEERLQSLRGSTGAIATEERQKVDKEYERNVTLWRKRKHIFKALWATVTENLPRKLSEFQEELGVETDEDAGCSLADFELPTSAPVRRVFQIAGAKRKEPHDSGRQFGKVIQKNRVVGPTPKAEGSKPAKPPKARKKNEPK